MSILAKFGGDLISGAGGLASNIIGGLFSRKNTKDTNAQNLRIAQMNNEWSERMMEKQNLMNVAQWQRESDFSREQMDAANAFTEKMWQKQADYNSAAAQVKRLKEAGLNPALAMGSQNAGSVSGAQGAQGATPSGNSVGLPSPSTATMQTDNLGQYIARSAEIGSMIARNSAEANSLETQSDVAKAKLADELAALRAKTRSQDIKNYIDDVTKSTIVGIRNEQYLNELQKRINAGLQEELLIQQKVYQNLVNTNLPEQMKADIAVKRSMVDLNKFNTQSDLGKFLQTLEKKYNMKISKSDLRGIFEAWKFENQSIGANNMWDALSKGITGTFNGLSR